MLLYNGIKRTLTFFAFSAIILFVQAQQQYARVKIYADDNGLRQLAEKGVGFDHGEYKKGQYFISDFSEQDITVLKNQGAKFEIIIPDVAAYYVRQNDLDAAKTTTTAGNICGKIPVFKTPTDFNLGSMGGLLYLFRNFGSPR